MIIEDGHGTGSKVKVGEEGCLNAKAVTVPMQQHINEQDGESYSVIIDKTPTGAGDCFFYIKNNSDKDMFVTSGKISAATDETVRIKLKDVGTPVGGTANVPVNRNAGSGKKADVTCQDGVDITGLSGGEIVEQVDVDGAVGSVKYPWASGLIIPKNQTLTMYAVTGAIALKSTLSIAFHTPC